VWPTEAAATASARYGYLAHNVNLPATFVAAGPGIRHRDPMTGVRAIEGRVTCTTNPERSVARNGAT
jgi:hypothetical protein